ncbi:glycosyltransferase family 4 protein [Aeromonas sp. A-5]|uniref:glycosyltransferase family 4 protein n=1 Tax=Aeromonas ichthyocola TaxID=3367746 RepID=UPI0038E43FEE
MKVAIVLPSLKNVGPVKVAFDLVSSLSSEIDFTVFYIKESSGFVFPCITKKLTWQNILSLYKFDVIHSHMLRPDFITAVLPFYRGKKITTIHNMVKEDVFFTHGKFISSLISPTWMNIWKRFDRLVVLTDVARNYYLNLGLLNHKLHVINNGVAISKVPVCIPKEDRKLIYDFSKGKKILGSVCLFNHRKGLDQIIRALPILKDFCFVVVGDGPIKNELSELAESLGVSDRFLIIGFRENAKKYIDLFDIYMMPSRSEGFGLAMVEAVSVKKAVVCSNIDVFKSMFSENEVSYFNLEDISSLVTAIFNAVEHSDTYSNNAYSRCLQFYTTDIMAKKYFDVYSLKGVN